MIFYISEARLFLSYYAHTDHHLRQEKHRSIHSSVELSQNQNRNDAPFFEPLGLKVR